MGKPFCDMAGVIRFNLAGKVKKTLYEAGLLGECKKFTDRIRYCGSFEAMVKIAEDYVEIKTQPTEP
jgi:hypothetical protein